MATYAFRRILQSVPLLCLLSILLFFIVRAAPGGPLSAAQRSPEISLEQIDLQKKQLGLDQPLPVQYLKWLGRLVLQGDLGTSIKFRRPVAEMIAERIRNTLLLMGISFVVMLLIAVPVGILSARKPYSIFDYLATSLAFIGQSFPVFWLGLLLILVFSVTLENPLTGTPLFPVGGAHTIGLVNSWGDRLWHLCLPVATLSLGGAAWYTRFLRSSLLEVMNQDFIRTARAKGLRDRLVYYKHALGNAILPLITLIGLDLPGLFTGALLVETVFSWPGMGRLFWEAAGSRDYPVLLGVLVINAALVIACNLLADLMYGWLDPRVKYG